MKAKTKSVKQSPPKLPKIKWVDAHKEMPNPGEYVLVYIPQNQNSVWLAVWNSATSMWCMLAGLEAGLPAIHNNIVTHWAYPEAK